MDNIIINNFNNREYICIKKVFVNGTEYRVFLNAEDRKNVKITDAYLNIVKDKKIIEKVAGSVFAVFNGILYSEDDSKPTPDIDDLYDDDETIIVDGKEVPLIRRPLNDLEFDLVIGVLKKEFFSRFGRKVLTEEELNQRIERDLKSIVVTNKFMADGCSHTGEYNITNKEIRVPSISSKDILSLCTLFHEFIHAITCPGARKAILIDEYDGDEVYTYGSRVDEGIVSYIELSNKPLRYNKYQDSIGYNPERRYIGIIAQLYNFNDGSPIKRNFIEEFIRKPDDTLGRVEELFYEEEVHLHPKTTPSKEIRTISMKKALNFITDYDYLDSEKVAEDRVRETLKGLVLSKIRRLKLKSRDELYDVLYLLEGISHDFIIEGAECKEVDKELEDAKTELIRRYFRSHPNASLKRTIAEIPTHVKDTPTTAEERLLASIFGDETKPDERYYGIKAAFKNYYVEIESKEELKRREEKRKKDGDDRQEP